MSAWVRASTGNDGKPACRGVRVALCRSQQHLVPQPAYSVPALFAQHCKAKCTQQVTRLSPLHILRLSTQAPSRAAAGSGKRRTLHRLVVQGDAAEARHVLLWDAVAVRYLRCNAVEGRLDRIAPADTLQLHVVAEEHGEVARRRRRLTRQVRVGGRPAAIVLPAAGAVVCRV